MGYTPRQRFADIDGVVGVKGQNEQGQQRSPCRTEVTVLVEEGLQGEAREDHVPPGLQWRHVATLQERAT